MNALSRKLEAYITHVDHSQLCLRTAEQHVRQPRIAVQSLQDIGSELARLRAKLVEHQTILEREEEADNAQRFHQSLDDVRTKDQISEPKTG